MDLSIRLEKAFITKLYAYAFQGYRSIHRALQKGYWSSFLAYYDLKKRSDLDMLVCRLDVFTPPHFRDLLPPAATELAEITPALGAFRFLFRKWLNRRKQNWRFGIKEIRYVRCVVERLRALLELSQPPSTDTLIALRNDLCNCTGIIESRCYGLADLERAKLIEHFDHTDRVRHLTLHEIIGERPATSGDLPSRAAG